MADVLFTVVSTTKAKLLDVPVKDGQMIFVTDAPIIAFDDLGARTIYHNIENITEAQRLGEATPIPGFYYCYDTNMLWRYENEWTALIQESKGSLVQKASYIEFPNLGNSTFIYVDTSTEKMYRWDDNELKYYTIGSTSNSDWHDIEIINGGTV